ncbi:MAG: sigma-54 dependent transcriptional regulator [Nitrospinota bacterium]|nr:sigma-54 dependent transcriptional regulator [Nitrospinota bacterium]
MPYILVAGAPPEARKAIADCFTGKFHGDFVDGVAQAQALARERTCEFLLVDVNAIPEPVSGRSRAQALEPFKAFLPASAIIVMAPAEKTRLAVDYVRAGAGNYLAYPIVPEEVFLVLETQMETQAMQQELDYLRDEFLELGAGEMLNTSNPAMAEVFHNIRKVAKTKTTVLLSGETGVGKGVLAQLIHQNSGRANGPFVSVHCGAIPDTLLESELFGHEKGAFTGAFRRKLGKFEIARAGTIFLDEIGTITPAAQVKLLHVLQNQSLQRIGGESDIEADVRIIAASNSDLKAMAAQGSFRPDLYYRLSVFPIPIPPLRERKEDIPALVEHILRKHNRSHMTTIRSVSKDVMSAMMMYSWPGNIRELENLMERAVLIETGPELTASSFSADLMSAINSGSLKGPRLTGSIAEARRNAIEKLEREYLEALLHKHGGKIGISANTAGITTRQLSKLLKKYVIRKERYKGKPEL